jgi:hypothetical protein
MRSSEFGASVNLSLDEVKARAIAMCSTPPCTFSFDTGWTPMAFEKGKSEALYYGYRGMTYQAEGTVTVTRDKSGAYTTSGEYSVNAYKSWNFDKNENLKGVPFRGPAYAAGFGLAREFAVVGTGGSRKW